MRTVLMIFLLSFGQFCQGKPLEDLLVNMQIASGISPDGKEARASRAVILQIYGDDIDKYLSDLRKLDEGKIRIIDDDRRYSEINERKSLPEATTKSLFR